MDNLSCIVKDKLNTPVEEAYKVLRTNIQFFGIENRIKTLAITSCNPKEGKTTTSINLAISMAKSGMNVVLIDADLRKPMSMKRLEYSNNNGLSNYISGKCEIKNLISQTNIENLSLIGCGPKPPNPAELVGSDKFLELLQILDKQFDMIIIDTPPLGSVIDCAIIATRVDATLLVIESKAIEYKNAQRVKEQLEKVNARVLGVVLNKVVKRDFRNYYNNYSYYKDEKYMNKNWFKKLKAKNS